MTASTVPLSVNHSGQIPAVTISFDLAPGKALSDAVTGIRNASDDIAMPPSIQGNFQGTAAAFEDSTKNMGALLLIAMVVVYIILGILYESFIHPLTILSGLPSAAVGGLLTLWIAHLLFMAGITPVDMSLTLYAFVGLIMLIGIVKKNDNHGGADGHIAHRLRQRRWSGIAPSAGTVRGGRPAAVAASDPLHHASDLYLPGPLQHPDAAPQVAPPRRGSDAGGVVISP